MQSKSSYRVNQIHLIYPCLDLPPQAPLCPCSNLEKITPRNTYEKCKISYTDRSQDTVGIIIGKNTTHTMLSLGRSDEFCSVLQWGRFRRLHRLHAVCLFSSGLVFQICQLMPYLQLRWKAMPYSVEWTRYWGLQGGLILVTASEKRTNVEADNTIPSERFAPLVRDES